MRAILTFRLPQERCEFNIASRAMDWAFVCLDMDTWLRNLIKYGSESMDVATIEKCRNILREFLNEHGVSLEDIE